MARKPWKLVNEDIFQPRSIALKLINNRLEARMEEGRAHQNSSTVPSKEFRIFEGF